MFVDFLRTREYSHSLRHIHLVYSLLEDVLEEGVVSACSTLEEVDEILPFSDIDTCLPIRS